MVAAFIDESGNDNRSPVFAMVSILLCDFASYYFGNDWLRLLAKFKVTEYHSTDFYGKRKDFRGWTDSQARDFLQNVIALFLKYEIKHGGVVVLNDDYRRSFVETGFHKVLRPAISKWKKPYLQAFQHIVADLRKYAEHQASGVYIRPVFDDCQEFMGQAQQDYAQFNNDGRLGLMFVSNAREFVQLQAADFLAWEYRVHGERWALNRDRAPSENMKPLLQHMFLAQPWTFEYLEYLRMRIEAVMNGDDPETVRAPGE